MLHMTCFRFHLFQMTCFHICQMNRFHMFHMTCFRFHIFQMTWFHIFQMNMCFHIF